MRTLYTPTLCALLLAVIHAPAAAQSARTAISIGAGAHPLGSAGPIVQADYLLTERVSVGVRYTGGLEYSYEDGSYTENGSGSGVELVASYCFHGAGHQGPYVTAGLGRFTVDWDWYDASARPNYGFGRTRGAEVSATFGWKFPLGPRLYLDPAVTAGHFFGTAKDSTGSRTSELGTYAALSIKLGWRF